MRPHHFVSGVLLLITIGGCAGSGKPPASQDPAVASGAGDAVREEREEDRIGGLPASVHFRWRQRRSEDGTLPDFALTRAMMERRAMLQNTATGPSLPAGSESLAQSWSWLGPGNIGGRIRGFAIHPTNPALMWIGAASGGIWRTVNSGGVWTPVNDFMASLTISCMAMDPTNPNTLYVGTGEGFWNTAPGANNTAVIQGAGIFRSTDGGTTWPQLASTVTADFYLVNRIAIAPGNGQLLVVATDTGIFRSIDGGANWTQTFVGRTFDVRFHPTDATRLVAGLSNGIALYSTNAGASWTAATGITGQRVEIAYARSAPATVYAAVSGADHFIRVWRSTNGGLTYVQQTTTATISTYELYNNCIWVDPTNPNNMIVGGINIYRSTNAGVSFTAITSGTHPDHHGVVEHPSFNGTSNRTVFGLNDGGIHRANDYLSATWQELNNNLGITQFYGGAISASGVVVGGTQDNGSLRWNGGTENWTSWFGGDGGFCAADPVDPNYIYGEIYRLQIFRSTNGGASASYITSGIADATPNFICHFVLDPNNANRMLAGGGQLWRTNNVKAAPPAWTSIKPVVACGGLPLLPPIPPSHFDPDPPCNISTIAVAKNNSDIIWVGHNNGRVYLTTNGTAAVPAWIRVDENGVGLPDRWIARIAIDPSNPLRVYVALLGYASNNLWRTTDGGLSWTPISGSGATAIPSAPIACITLHPLLPGWLYVATDFGIYVSTNDGATWSTTNEGPAGVAVDELVFKNNRDLLAVTHGRGMFLGRSFDDCNNNLIPDFMDISNLTSQDCNGNLIPDECDIASLTSMDINGNNIPDECEQATITPVGAGCGLLGAPVLTGSAPRIGLIQNYGLGGATPSVQSWLVLSFGTPVAATLSPGCTVQIDLAQPVFLPTGVTSAIGTMAFGLSIPNLFSLINIDATAQAITFVGTGPLLGAYEMSNALSMTIGF